MDGQVYYLHFGGMETVSSVPVFVQNPHFFQLKGQVVSAAEALVCG